MTFGYDASLVAQKNRPEHTIIEHADTLHAYLLLVGRNHLRLCVLDRLMSSNDSNFNLILAQSYLLHIALEDSW